MKKISLLPALAMMAMPLCLQSCSNPRNKPISPHVAQAMEFVADYNVYNGKGLRIRTKLQQEYYLRFLFRTFVEQDRYSLALQYGHMLYDLRQTATIVNKAEQKELEMLLALCEIADGFSVKQGIAYEKLKELAKEGVPFAEKSLVIMRHFDAPDTDSPLYNRYLENKDEDLMFAIREGTGSDKTRWVGGVRQKRYLQGLIAHHYSMANEEMHIWYPTDVIYPGDEKRKKRPAYYRSGPLQGEPLDPKP